MKRSYQPTIPKERTRRLQGPVLIVYAFTITVFIFAFIVFAQFTAKRQGDLLYQEKIQAGKIGLNHFMNNAAIPLLDDDALSLNALLKEAIPYQCTYLVIDAISSKWVEEVVNSDMIRKTAVDNFKYNLVPFKK